MLPEQLPARGSGSIKPFKILEGCIIPLGSEMKLCAVVLVFTASVVFQVCAQDGEPVINCPKEDFTKNDACCKIPVGDLVTNNMAKSCKPTKTLLKWMNDYMMNAWLKFDKESGENTFNFTSNANNKLMCSVAPFVNCVFDKYKIMDLARTYWNGTNAMIAINMTKRNETWTETLASVVEHGPNYATDVFNQTITCAGPKKTQVKVYIGNLWLVQYLQSYISMTCYYPNYTEKNKCEKKMDETFPYCHMWLESNAWGKRKSELPQILKEARQKIFNSPQGKNLKAMLAAMEKA